MTLSRAYDYPYDWRRTPFLFVPDEGPVEARVVDMELVAPGDAAPVARLTVDTEAGRCVIDDCHPVIASGSNGAPAQLARKFAGERVDSPIAVVPVGVDGIVPVHSAHVARYGSIPATLCREVGAHAVLPVLFCAPETLDLINETEALGVNYALSRLDGLNAEVAGKPLDSVLIYRSLHGVYAPGGAPLRLAAALAQESGLVPVTQRDMLAEIHRLVGSSETLDAFVARLVVDHRYRSAVTARLHRHAVSDGLKAVPVRNGSGDRVGS